MLLFWYDTLDSKKILFSSLTDEEKTFFSCLSGKTPNIVISTKKKTPSNPKTLSPAGTLIHYQDFILAYALPHSFNLFIYSFQFSP